MKTFKITTFILMSFLSSFPAFSADMPRGALGEANGLAPPPPSPTPSQTDTQQGNHSVNTTDDYIPPAPEGYDDAPTANDPVPSYSTTPEAMETSSESSNPGLMGSTGSQFGNSPILYAPGDANPSDSQ